jgi:hypothetical protein
MADSPRADTLGGGDRSLFDQVRDRVSAAESALGAGLRIPRRARPTRALWRVFHDFGTSYRQHRRETGAPPVPAVRDAAEAFRREPTLTTLVAVAALLDQHGLLSRSA